MGRGETEMPAIVTATSVFTTTDQRPTAVIAENIGFSHSFSCTLNERNRTDIAILPIRGLVGLRSLYKQTDRTPKTQLYLAIHRQRYVTCMYLQWYVSIAAGLAVVSVKSEGQTLPFYI